MAGLQLECQVAGDLHSLCSPNSCWESIFFRLPKNASMQGPRNPEEGGVRFDVRHNDEGLGKRSRWTFFSSLKIDISGAFDALALNRQVGVLPKGSAVHLFPYIKKKIFTISTSVLTGFADLIGYRYLQY
jgi:hypothetical protein